MQFGAYRHWFMMINSNKRQRGCWEENGFSFIPVKYVLLLCHLFMVADVMLCFVRHLVELIWWRMTSFLSDRNPPEDIYFSPFGAAIFLRLKSLLVQSPGEIKRREVSWIPTKTLDSFAGPGEIKRREVVLDPQVSPEEETKKKQNCSQTHWFLSRRYTRNGVR